MGWGGAEVRHLLLLLLCYCVLFAASHPVSACACVCFCVCSTWYADALWAVLGLPDSWLHGLCQATLAPVRLLWHTWPRYVEYYNTLDAAFDVATTGSSASGLAFLLFKVVSEVVVDSLAGLASSEVVLVLLSGVVGAWGLHVLLSSSSFTSGERVSARHVEV